MPIILLDGWKTHEKKKAGGLEHHIPPRFTENRPAFRFYHVQHHMARAHHPIASTLPGPTTTLTVSVDPSEPQRLWTDPNAPATLQDYLQNDEPQLGLAIVSFDDSTIVSISWTHSLFDAMGFGEFVHAWSLMVQDRQDEIREPFGTEHDALADLGLHPSTPNRLENLRLSWLGIVIYYCRLVLEMLLRKQQSRMIYVPSSFVQRLHRRATSEMTDKNQGGTDQFLSDGDILFAWWVKLGALHLSGSGKLVHLTGALGWRPTLQGDLLPVGRPYISNAFGFFGVLVPARDLCAKSIGWLALQIRQSITESRSRDQIESYATLWRQSKNMSIPLFGHPAMHMMVYSNWSNAKLFELDFSAAALPPGNTLSSARQGRASYVQSCFRGVRLTEFMIVVGKDSSGGYWVTAITNARHWSLIEHALSQNKEPDM